TGQGGGPAGGGAEGGWAQQFPPPAEAEAWLTEAYEDLVDEGITEASLYEGDRLVYGPMSLLPEQPA
ncbi:MAG: hypothetical protein L0G99_15420, partial [Propionibacteriales bacterium]|nr:hypothetical protein [Propionibacteriales bacterium]